MEAIGSGVIALSIVLLLVNVGDRIGDELAFRRAQKTDDPFDLSPNDH